MANMIIEVQEGNKWITKKSIQDLKDGDMFRMKNPENGKYRYSRGRRNFVVDGKPFFSHSVESWAVNIKDTNMNISV